jgi:predicted aldo/keto reductase-like oxidoreductase
MKNQKETFEQGFEREMVSLIIDRQDLYHILKSAEGTSFDEVVRVCQQNIHIPECESLLNDIEEEYQEWQAHQNFIRAELYESQRGETE